MLSAQLSALRAPPAVLRTFGSGCSGSNGVVTLDATGAPRLGQSYVIGLRHGAVASPALMFLGRSYRLVAGLPLPLALSAFGGGPGCYLYGSAEAAVPALTDGAGTASVTMSVPLDLDLVGATLFHGWAVLDPAAPQNPLGVTTSNAAVAVLGF